MWYFRKDKVSKDGLYPLGDFLTPKQYYQYAAVWTGEKREPKKGEWYISGAVPTAYKAINDLTEKYHIAKVYKIKKHEYWTLEGNL
jgi:hypothetical protein